MIFIERDTPLSREQMEEKLRILLEAVERTDAVDAPYVSDAIAAVVPTYRDPEVVNSAVK